MQLLPPTCFPHAMLGYATLNALTQRHRRDTMVLTAASFFVECGLLPYLVCGQVLRYLLLPGLQVLTAPAAELKPTDIKETA